MKMKSESEVAQPCLTLLNPMDCSLPGSSVHWIFQARVPEWGAIAFSEMEIQLHIKHSFLKFYIIMKENNSFLDKKHEFFKKVSIFKLKDNSFTVLYWFLANINMNQS